MTFGELFAGIGGFSLGLERAGMQCKWQVEIDPYAQAVLRKHWPDVPKHDDVRTFPPQGDYSVDLICGGFPCQDISVAGKGAGLAGARSGLWYEFARIIRAVRPRWVVIENVPALTARGLGTVLGDLAEIGMDAEWHCIPACSVGAPHRRDRIWIVARDAHCGDECEITGVSCGTNAISSGVCGESDVADSYSERVRVSGCSETACTAGGSESKAEERQRIWPDASASCEGCDVANSANDGHAIRPGMHSDRERAVSSKQGDCGGASCGRCQSCGCGGDVSDANRAGRQQQRRPEPVRAEQPAVECGGWWESEPNVGRVAHGVPSRVDRLRCLGNAVVPQVVEIIGRAILEAEARMTA